MKKFGIRLPILCAALLLVGVTALATVVKSVSNLKKEDAHVTVTLKSGTGDPAFTVTRDNATKGKKYLLLIRNGPEEADPTEENIVYMDVETATSDVVTFSNAYPMPMENGLYRVYMTDYEKNELKQVATFDVGDSGDSGNNADSGNSGNGGVIGGNSGDSDNSTDGGNETDNPSNALELGDVNGKDGIDAVDALLALQISAHLIEWTDEQFIAADVDRSDGVDAVDALLILQKSAQLISSFPDNSRQS